MLAATQAHPVTVVTMRTRPAPPPLSLIAEVAQASYAEGSTERAVFDFLNDVRAKGNFGRLAQDPRLDVAAAAHAGYIARNPSAGLSHVQSPDRPGFLGQTPMARARAVGYVPAASFEVISSGTSAPVCLEMLNTVYHLGLLMTGSTDIGVAVNPAVGCVIDLHVPGPFPRMQVRRAGTVGVYPYPSQAGVPTAFIPATETPRPLPELGDAVVGPPILVDLSSEAAAKLAADEIVLSRFVLAEAGSGSPVPARVIASQGVSTRADSAVALGVDNHIASAGHVFLVPMRPLKAATSYVVDFSGSVSGVPVSRRWDFTTR